VSLDQGEYPQARGFREPFRRFGRAKARGEDGIQGGLESPEGQHPAGAARGGLQGHEHSGRRLKAASGSYLSSSRAIASKNPASLKLPGDPK